jgi:hypothetical protein
VRHNSTVVPAAIVESLFGRALGGHRFVRPWLLATTWRLEAERTRYVPERFDFAVGQLPAS